MRQPAVTRRKGLNGGAISFLPRRTPSHPVWSSFSYPPIPAQRSLPPTSSHFPFSIFFSFSFSFSFSHFPRDSQRREILARIKCQSAVTFIKRSRTFLPLSKKTYGHFAAVRQYEGFSPFTHPHDTRVAFHLSPIISRTFSLSSIFPLSLPIIATKANLKHDQQERTDDIHSKDLIHFRLLAMSFYVNLKPGGKGLLYNLIDEYPTLW